MGGKDVELRIKARDDASANVKKISDALKALNGDTQDAAKGSGKLAGAVGGLSTDVAKLQREMDRLKAVGQIASEFDKSSSAVRRLETSLKGVETEFTQLTRHHNDAVAISRKLQTQLSGESQAREENKSALAASRKELTAINALVKEATDAQTALNAARSRRAGGNIASANVGLESGSASSSARASMGVFIEADLNKQRAAQARVTAEVKNYDGAVKALTSTIKSTRVDLSAAETQQARLTTAVDKSTAANVRGKAALAAAQAELTNVGAAVRTASSSMNGMVVTQEAVAQSAERMAAQLAKAKAQIATLGDTRAPVAAGQNLTGSAQENGSRREAIERLRELRREMVTAQADAQRLNSALRSTSQPTEELGASAGRAQATVRNLKTELNELTTRLRASSGGFKEFDQAAGGVNGTARQVSAANAQIASTAERAGTGQRQIAPAVRQTGAAMGEAASKTNVFNGALLGLGSGTRQSLSLMQRLRGEVLALTASYLGFHAAIGQIGGAITAYQKLEAVQSRLGAVFKQDTVAVAREVDFLRAQADRLGISFGVLADEYGKFTVAANAANFSVAETREVFLSVAEAGRVNKLSMDQMSGVFLALTQMISKGKVSSEELRRQLGDRMTGAFQIFADAIGMTSAELDKAMQKGEVLANKSTLLKFADELRKRFGPQLSASLDTVTADLGRFENSTFNAQLSLAQGLIPALRDALKSFNEFAASSQGHLFFTELGTTIGKFISILAEVPKYFGLIKSVIQGFVAVKLAGFFIDVVGKIGQFRAALTGLSSQMAFVGPQMQQMGVAQRVLGQGFAQVIGRIDAYRASLLASTAATSTASFGTLAFARTLGAMRTAMLVTAGAARALWAAFGGLPGIIATGIAVAVGGWMTNVDSATTALTEHARQIDVVKNAYYAAGENLDGWANTIKGLTLTEAETNLANLTKEYDSKIRELQNRANGIRIIFDRLNGPMGGEVRAANGDAFADGVIQIVKLVDALAAGDKTVAEFREELDQIAQTNANDSIRLAAAELLEFTREADEGQTSLTNLGAAVKAQSDLVEGLRGETSKLTDVVTDSTDAIDDNADAFDRAAAIKTYTDAIDTLKGKIPALTAELKKLKDMTEINKAAWEGMTAAFQAGDYGKVAQVISLWAQAAGAITDQETATMMAAYPGAGKDVIERIIYIEGGQKGGGPSTSSARGIGQFTEGTWLGLFDRIFPELAQLNETQKLALRTNEEAARKMLHAFTQDNQAALIKRGIDPNPGNTYLSHFLGSPDAIKVLLANPEELAANLVQKGSVSANPTIFKPGMTAGDLSNWANQKMGGGSPIQSSGQTKQEETDRDIQLRIDALNEEASARAINNREAEIAKELARAQAQATKDGTTLTEEQIAALREAVGAKYDALHVGDELKTQQQEANIALQQATALATQRNALEKEFLEAQKAGNHEQAFVLETSLASVNDELAVAIERARSMWQAIGGPQADLALTKLDTLAIKTGNAGAKMGMFGLTMQQWGNLAGSFADGLVGVFDGFAQAIANGEDAVGALGTAFLQFAADFLRQIATMILKQMVLNALQSFFPGLPIGHIGGVVGSKAIGGGNGKIATSPSWMKNAFTYHTGGIAGFKPDEVNATLRIGEEILTEEDPRHRNNLGGEESVGSSASRGIKQVLVLDPKDLSNAMASRAGEEVVVTHIKNNVGTIRQMLR